MIYAVFVLNERETTTDLIRFQWLVLTVCCVCVSEWISFVSLVSCCISGALALVKVVLLIPSVSLVSAIDWPAAFICDWAHELSSWVACGWYRESLKHAYQTERIIRLVSSYCRRSTERLSNNWKKKNRVPKRISKTLNIQQIVAAWRRNVGIWARLKIRCNKINISTQLFGCQMNQVCPRVQLWTQELKWTLETCGQTLRINKTRHVKRVEVFLRKSFAFSRIQSDTLRCLSTVLNWLSVQLLQELNANTNWCESGWTER